MLEKLKSKFKFHWQNLNDLYSTCSKVKSQGPMWKHGRCWLSYKGKDYKNNYDAALTINPEWSIGKESYVGAGLRFGGREDSFVSSHINLPFASFYITLDVIKLRFLKDILVGKAFEKDTSISFHSNTVWINIFTDNSIWESKAKWWKQRQFSINFETLILGKRTYERKLLDEIDTVIPMPEGNYKAHIKIEELIHRRPRWFDKKYIQAIVEPDKPIPYPGKGENSWDCGEDGLHSMSCPAKNFEDAIAATVQSVLRDRRRYGYNINWESKEKKSKKKDSILKGRKVKLPEKGRNKC